MSSQWSGSKAFGEQQPSQPSSPPTASYNNVSASRSSTGSSASIADIEAGFLPGGANKQQKTWKDTLPFRIFTKRVPSPNTDSSSDDATNPTKYRWLSLLLLIALVGVTATLLGLEIPRRAVRPINGIQIITSRWGLPTPSTQKALTTWPTDFSRDIKPIPCHSHNDYWRRVPLYDALAAGCTGVEADVWLDPQVKDDLYVGHTQKSLAPARTLKSLYIDPLLTILNNQNSPSNSSSTAASTDQLAGVFDTSTSTSLTLLIDLKTSSESTFPLVLSALQPLLKANYLTTWTSERGLTPGPITVVGTGLTNFTSEILSPQNSNPRIIFFDAFLPALSSLTLPNNGNDYNKNNSYYASVSFDAEIGKPFLGFMTPAQVRKVRRQIEAAKQRGLVSRYWDTPAWPVGLKMGVWDVLSREGVGILSVDDLVGVRGFWEDGAGAKRLMGKGI
ncbi:MAG: hypothetical protein Q9166_007793 [cf. Caloplaca sp. 2 TL-2023]